MLRLTSLAQSRKYNHYITYSPSITIMCRRRKQKYPVVLLFVIVISSVLILIALLEGNRVFQITSGQQENQQNVINTSNTASNQTSIMTNQSGALIDSIQNQTIENQTGTAALSANLTQGDFESLKQDLSEARQALENNDTTTVLDELNSASGELFIITSQQFDPAHVEAMTQEFDPLQTHLDQAQEAALKNEHTRMLEELNAAESEVLKITQTLPSDQE
jgi:hypothetical protein